MKRRWLLDLSIFALLFAALNWWQTKNIVRGFAPSSFVYRLDNGASEPILGETSDLKIIYFFAPWCGVCKQSIGNTFDVAKRFSHVQSRFIALDYENRNEVLEFAKQYVPEGMAYLGGQDIKQSWRVEAYPSYAIVNKAGEIVSVNVGYSTYLGLWLRLWWFSYA